MASKTHLLILGSGMTEQVFARKAKESPCIDKIYAIPGNPEMADIACCEKIGPKDIDGILAFRRKFKTDVVFLGSPCFFHKELIHPLKKNGALVIGPLEETISLYNPIALRALMQNYKVCMPLFHLFNNKDSTFAYCKNVHFPLILRSETRKLPTTVCQSIRDVEKYFSLDPKQSSEEQEKIIVEEFISDNVFSLGAILMQSRILTFPMCQLVLHRGNLLGGMIPACFEYAKTQNSIEKFILIPVVHALNQAIKNFQGFLFLDVAVSAKGLYLLDCRFHWSHVAAQTWLLHFQGDIISYLRTVFNTKNIKTPAQWHNTTLTTLIPKEAKPNVTQFFSDSGTFLAQSSGQCLGLKEEPSCSVLLGSNAKDFSTAMSKLIQSAEKTDFSDNAELSKYTQKIANPEPIKDE
jgi:phosphoribosylamine--glycine ligase